MPPAGREACIRLGQAGDPGPLRPGNSAVLGVRLVAHPAVHLTIPVDVTTVKALPDGGGGREFLVRSRGYPAAALLMRLSIGLRARSLAMRIRRARALDMPT